jgi:hypothetical protein
VELFVTAIPLTDGTFPALLLNIFPEEGCRYVPVSVIFEVILEEQFTRSMAGSCPYHPNPLKEVQVMVDPFETKEKLDVGDVTLSNDLLKTTLILSPVLLTIN